MQVLSDSSSESEPEEGAVDPLVFSRDDFDTGRRVVCACVCVCVCVCVFSVLLVDY